MEFKANPRPIGRKYERVEKITTPPEEKSLPLILGFDKEKNEYIPTGGEKLKTPINEIESIEVVYNPQIGAALYGAKGLPCIIKVRFKNKMD
ncbi:MAG: hypothetical protein LBG19_10515 [Prevotellaceae bacterium]|jgi:hypothetical protein|nr:hypothetical protein [Prevotellaceae bacterium]